MIAGQARFKVTPGWTVATYRFSEAAIRARLTTKD
jgi:hypothetical protein